MGWNHQLAGTAKYPASKKCEEKKNKSWVHGADFTRMASNSSQVKSKPGRRVAGPFWAQAVAQASNSIVSFPWSRDASQSWIFPWSSD